MTNPTGIRLRHAILVGAAVLLLAGCGGNRNYAAKEDAAPRAGPKSKFDPDAPSVFGDGGLSIGNLNNGILGGSKNNNEGFAVNKYLWQGALDTLSFLPLASTDPFTGVIATEWGSTPEAPGERLKVTAYIVDPGLSAASLKVAVFRETRNSSGVWVPAPVSAETARQLEDAILTRARQIRIAELEGSAAS